MDITTIEFCLNWVSQNVPAIVIVLIALVPVMALAVAGYAIHIVGKK